MSGLMILDTTQSKDGSEQGGLVADLGALGTGMLAVAGGKAVNLGELIRAKLPVPPGFCVTTEAYRQVAAAAAIDYDALEAAGPEEAQYLAGKARAELLAAPIPGAVEQAVVNAYEELGLDVPVAVRSSATAEDLPHASFAGQQDTYLHVVGAPAVLAAVRRCWASLWTERAVVYRTTNGIDHRAVRLAVVVQRMVDAEVAGVMFTANPVTGHRKQTVIDASPGLGEAVVSGAVNPDHFVVDTASGEIVERRLGDKRLEVRPLAGGGTRHVARAAAANRACITRGQVRALAALGDWVQTLFGMPQDIEWAVDSRGRIWLTQSRPITTLFPVPEQPQTEEDNFHVYFCFSVAQGLYRPITPMGMSAFRMIASAVARVMGIRVDDPLRGPAVFAEAGHRLFIDLTSTLRGRIGRTLMTRVLDVMEARSAAILRGLFEEPGLSVTHKSPWVFLRRVMGIAAKYGVPLRVMHALLRPASARRMVERQGVELQQRLALPPDATAEARLAFVQEAIGTEVAPLLPTTMPLAAAGLAMLAVASRLLGEDTQPGDLETVLRGLPHNITTEMDLALWKLATSIRKDAGTARMVLNETAAELARRYHQGTLPSCVQQGVAGFLMQYGHRAVAEIDVGMPRWSDDPAHIFGVLANYLRLENPEMAPDTVFARGEAEAEAMIETLVMRARRRSGLRSGLVRFVLSRARELAGLREIPKYYVIVILAAVRRELAKVGAELAGRGMIGAPEDIFFLDLKEARAAVAGQDQQAVVAERRESYEAELRRRHIPRVILSDGTEPEALHRAPAQAGGLSGTPASAGTITGVARVVLDPVGAHLEPGEILVAPSTDPGWTPLFLTAGGLVMEMGGANSHGAVVAREYGIPAIVGVPGATLRIHTGQRITVDAGSGTITLVE